MNMAMMLFSKSLTLRKGTLQEPLLNAGAREERSIDYIELEYGAMHWHRRSSFLPCRLAEVAKDTAQSYLSLQTAD